MPGTKELSKLLKKYTEKQKIQFKLKSNTASNHQKRANQKKLN